MNFTHNYRCLYPSILMKYNYHILATELTLESVLFTYQHAYIYVAFL